jgi:UDP-GlcNAc:undecaprenyl-phosphate GlcNAc-1-phosphate transferase
MGDIVVRHLGNPLGFGLIELGPFAVPFTLLGIVGLINAINLLDGLDGLAGGVCTIICVTFAIISFNSGNTTLLFLSVALMGSLLGFLRYNHHPAIIFMGDSGSLLLGYCMGVFSVMLATGGTNPVSPYIPLLTLGVPILDTLVVMTNRLRTGKRLFIADNTHLHHRLLGLGIGHRMTVLIVFGFTYLLCILAIFGRGFSDRTLLLMLLSGGIAVYGVLSYLGSTQYRSGLDSIDESARQISQQSRTLAHRTGLLTVFIKYLVILTLVLPIFMSHTDIHRVAIFPPIILIISVITFLSRCTWNNVLLQGCIYVSGIFMVFSLENYGREEMVFGVPLTLLSHVVFMLLVLFTTIKALIRKRISRLIVSPFEYLIMLIVLSVPLLPPAISTQYHLLTVAAKSVVLFIAFKLILMRQLRRNRKIILAIVLTSLVLVLRSFFDW